jgi:hypothetical protein
MSGITVVFAVVSGVLVFAIAAGVIGREAHRLDAVAPRVVYELESAVQYVASALPSATQSRLTIEELRELLKAHLSWLHEHNLLPSDVLDRPQSITTPVVLDDTTLAAHLLVEAARRGVQVLDDVDVVHVADAHVAYLGAIGAVGPQANEI